MSQHPGLKDLLPHQLFLSVAQTVVIPTENQIHSVSSLISQAKSPIAIQSKPELIFGMINWMNETFLYFMTIKHIAHQPYYLKTIPPPTAIITTHPPFSLPIFRIKLNTTILSPTWVSGLTNLNPMKIILLIS